MNFYEDNLELVGFIAAAFDFPPEMLDHLIKTIPMRVKGANELYNCAWQSTS